MKKDIMKLIWKSITNPDFRFLAMGKYGLLNYMDDEKYLKRMYRINMGKDMDLVNPKLFNEKLQWLKLYDRNPLYTTMVDKYAAKKYVGEIIGDEYIIPTIGVWNRADDIDFDALPNQFVLKCTHDSHGLVICKDKSRLDITAARKKLNRALKRNYYYLFREWPYKNVPPQIIAEQYISNNSVTLPENLKVERGDESRIKEFNESKDGLTDYKIYCFNGTAKLMMIASNRFSDEQTRFDYFDRSGKWLDLIWGNPKSETKPYIEVNTEELFKIAEKLAFGIPHVRVDLYYSNGQIYFGEMTFYDASGFGKIESEGWDEMLGDWIELPISHGGGYTVIDGLTVFIKIAVRSSDDIDNSVLNDYKVLCFDGEPKIIEIHKNRFTERHTQDFYSLDWKPSGIKQGPASETPIEKPKNLKKMIELSRTLANGLTHVRIDWYEVNGKLYFGEITFYDGSGFEPFDDLESEVILGNMIHLPTNKQGG